MMIRLKIDDMRHLAAAHGGKCLSKEYVSADHKLTWMCSHGHTWDAFHSIVRQGGWCRQCLQQDRQRHSLEVLQDIAIKRGGKCISTEYKNQWTPLKWECKEGHQWSAKPGHVKNVGSWCPYCAKKAKLTIEQMQELAKKRGGLCVSKVYVNTHTKLTWQCDKGHKWKAAPSKILTGQWCSHYDCRYAKVSKKLRGDIKELQNIAKDRGGKLISKEYINRYVAVEWQCARGHQWKAKAVNIKFGLTWCPVCHPKRKDKSAYKIAMRKRSKKKTSR